MGYHRPRCNTEIKLDKLKRERKNLPKVTTVVWRDPDETLTEDQMEDLFPAKHLHEQ